MNIIEIQQEFQRHEAYRLSLIGEELELRNRYRNTPCGFHSDEEYTQAFEELRTLITAKELDRDWSIASNPPAEPEIFIGRESELRLIQDSFEKEHTPVWLCGLGGIGKSALARAFAARRKDHYDQILYLTYDRSVRQLVEDDSTLEIRGLEYNNSYFGSRLRYFRVKFEALKLLASQGRTLIVLDNCDDADFLRDHYLPEFLKLSGDILLTSRKKAERAPGIVIPIGPLPESLLDQMIDRYSQDEFSEKEREDIRRFASRIDYLTLPLAIKIRNRNLPDELIFTEVDLLGKYELKKAEVQALLYLAVMPMQGMPERLYLEWTGEREEILEQLESKLLLRRAASSGGQRMLQIHPLIAQKIKEILPPTVNNCRQYLIRLTDYIQGSSLSVKNNGRDGKNTWSRSREENQREAPYILALLELFAEPVPWFADGCDALVTWLWIMRYDKLAEDYSLKLYRAVYEFYGSNHPITAKCALRTAAMYWNTGRKEDSYRWYHLGYDIIHRSPRNSSLYLTVCFTAAEKLATNVYAELGDIRQSSQYLEEALGIWRSPDYPRETARRSPVFAMRQQCQYLIELGQIDQADEVWREIEGTAEEWLRNRASWLPFLAVQAELLDAKNEREAALSVTRKMLRLADIHSIGTHKEMIEAREKAADLYLKYGYRSDAMEEYRRTEALLLENYPNEIAWMTRIHKKLGGS